MAQYVIAAEVKQMSEKLQKLIRAVKREALDKLDTAQYSY